MPIIQLGNKIRQFKQLAVLQQCRLDRLTDPFSASQREHHREYLLLVAEILKQNWTVLLFERRFFQNRETYTEYLTKSQVVDKLLEALEAYEKCLTHQAEEKYSAQYDLTDLERHLTNAINVVHINGQMAGYEIERRPKTSWKCLKEYQGWKASWRDLMDPKKGKIHIKESEFPGIARLLDGRITVTFSAEKSEDEEELLLGDTLPEELVDAFDEAFENAADVDLQMESPIIPQEKAMAPSLVPQGRTGVPFRMKGIEDVDIGNVNVKAEDSTDGVAPKALKKRTSFPLTLRRKRPRFSGW